MATIGEMRIGLKLIVILCSSGIAAPGPGPMSFDNNADAKVGVWPFVVSLEIDGIHRCTGSLIDKEWVLTSRCIQGASPESVRAVLGSRRDVSMSVVEIQSWPFLVKLAEPVKYTPTIQRVCLAATGSKFFPGPYGLALSWQGDIVREYWLPVVDDVICDYLYPGWMRNDCICTGVSDLGDSYMCEGDYGGPFIFHSQGQWIQAGYAHYGNCALHRYPNFFQKAWVYEERIMSTIENPCFIRMESSRVPHIDSNSTLPTLPAAAGSVPEGTADRDARYLEDSEEE